MDDKITTPQTTARKSDSTSGDGHPSFPSEPFACPYCGQMLAPSVRVCVACRQPINPRDIAAAPPPPPAVVPASTWTRTPRTRRGEIQPRVQFSLLIFLIVLATSLGVATLALETLGPVKSQYVMPGIVLFSSIGVFLDASHRKLPKPLQWSIASLLVWIVVFPWYLARRRQPDATCPIIEMEARRFIRVILVLVLVGLLLSILLQYFRGPLK